MRRIFALIVALSLSLLPAAGLVAATSTQAAPAFANRITFTGRIVALPQSMALPETILVQVGAYTRLVRVTTTTRIVDRNYNLITISDLKLRQQVAVNAYSGPPFTVFEIRDVSLTTTVTLQMKGVLAAMPNLGLLCVSGVSITSTGTPRAFAQTASPCPIGTLPVYLSSRTRTQNQTGNTARVSDMRIGDSLTIAAAIINGQVVASQVQDLSLAAAISLQVQGQLESMPSASLLCLTGVKVIASSTPRTFAQTASPCSDASAFPVYLSVTSHIQDQNGAKAQLSNLKIGDQLLATGMLVNGQFTPTTIKDLSLQAGFATLTGTLVGVPQSTTFPTSLLLQVGGQTVLVTVYDTTAILDRNSTPIALSSLVAGNSLSVYGSYNGSQLAALQVRDLSLPVGTVMDLKGILASTPTAATVPPSGLLCLSGVSLASTPQSQALLASPCAAGQLPLYLNGNTQIGNHLGTSITMSQLNINDSLHVTGILLNGQLTATAITDTSI